MLRFPGSEWTLPHPIPGAEGEPIYQWLLRRSPSELGPDVPFPDLPDDERFKEPGRIGFAAGAWDGVIAGSGDADVASQVGTPLVDVLRGRSAPARRLKALYALLRRQSTLEYIDPLIQRLRRTPQIDPVRVRALGRWLACHSADRNPAKLGIALLGIAGEPDDRDVLLTFASHDEFTLYGVVGLKSLLPPAEARDAIWEIAKRTRGWGRIQAVRRLDIDGAPEIRDWLLREGFRNAVMDEEVAYHVATTADLRAALAADPIDRELFRGAGDLISALIDSPFKGIDDYADAPEVVRQYVRHAESMARELEDFRVAWDIRFFLTGDPEKWKERARSGWTVAQRQELISALTMILDRPEWPDRALHGLASTDAHTFSVADGVARHLGINTSEFHVQRLGDLGADRWHWTCILSQASPEELPARLEMCRRLVEPERIATGAAMELGVGPGFERHGVVESVVQATKDHPGAGMPFLLAALKSPVIRQRWLATQTLAAWGRERWPAEAEAALREAVAVEPQDKTRDLMTKLLT